MQITGINVHNAAVKNVWTLDGYPIDHFILDFGDGRGSELTFFFTDDEWNAIVALVAEKRALLRAQHIRREAEKIRCAECNRTDQTTSMETDVCDECVAKLTGVDE